METYGVNSFSVSSLYNAAVPYHTVIYTPPLHPDRICPTAHKLVPVDFNQCLILTDSSRFFDKADKHQFPRRVGLWFYRGNWTVLLGSIVSCRSRMPGTWEKTTENGRMKKASKLYSQPSWPPLFLSRCPGWDFAAQTEQPKQHQAADKTHEKGVMSVHLHFYLCFCLCFCFCFRLCVCLHFCLFRAWSVSL